MRKSYNEAEKKSFDNDEFSLRPKFFSEYVGQTQVKNNLKIFIEAAKKRNQNLDHVLLYGSPGLGKTTLAHIIANELCVEIKAISAPAIERSGDLAAILTNLNKNDILFIDEIHRLSKVVEEILYSAMEDYCLDIIIGKGPSARNMRLTLNPFTLIGATTRAGMISEPLRDRFGVVERLELYNIEELTIIIIKTAELLNVEINNQAANYLAQMSRGTPRIAIRLLKRIRDFADIHNNSNINLELIKHAFKEMDIDSQGLNAIDRKLLLALIQEFNGGPIGVNNLSAYLDEEIVTIEEYIEPFLIQNGYMARTSRGRIALKNAYEHFNIPIPNDKQFADSQLKMDL